MRLVDGIESTVDCGFVEGCNGYFNVIFKRVRCNQVALRLKQTLGSLSLSLPQLKAIL